MAIIDEDNQLFSADLRILPFTIEAYLPTNINYVDDDGMDLQESATRIFTKSGFEYDLLLSIEEFEELIK